MEKIQGAFSDNGTETVRHWRKTSVVKSLTGNAAVRRVINSGRTILCYFYKVFRRPFIPRFRLNGKIYSYFYSPRNFTYRNERIVEIPIEWEGFESVRSEEVSEVGNVLAQYHPVPHDVIDKYEVAPGVINEDVETFDTTKRYKLIISISTMEHVGWDDPDEKDAQKILRSIENLKRLLAPGGEILITTPFGHNEFLDELVDAKKISLEAHYLKRISWMNEWREVSFEEARGTRYDYPFPAANALFIGTYRKEGL